MRDVVDNLYSFSKIIFMDSFILRGGVLCRRQKKKKTMTRIISKLQILLYKQIWKKMKSCRETTQCSAMNKCPDASLIIKKRKRHIPHLQQRPGLVLIPQFEILISWLLTHIVQLGAACGQVLYASQGGFFSIWHEHAAVH